MLDSLRKCVGFIGRNRGGRWLLLLVLALVVSAFEAGGALLVFLLMGLLTSPGETLEHPRLQEISRFLPDASDHGLLLTVAAFTAIFFVSRAVVSLGQSYLQHRVAHNAGARLSVQLLGGYLAMPQEFHLRRNSAELIRNAYDTVQVVVREVFEQSTRLISETLVVIGMVAVLLVTAPQATALALAVLGPLTYILLRVVHPWLKRLGATKQRMAKDSLQSLQQCLQGARDIKLLGREAYFRRTFARQRAMLSRAYYLRGTARDIPRLALETSLILFVIAFLGLTVITGESGQSALPVLGVFGYTALRIQPSLNKILAGLNAIKFASPAIDHLHEDLQLIAAGAEPAAARDAEPLPFDHAIRLEGVSFRYAGTDETVLHDIDLEIRRGESIGIVGPTGGGKSTLVDILIGILKPTDGQVRIDGVDIADHTPAWQRNLGVVPQTVFLLDDTLRRNIALGLPDEDIDEDSVREASRLAQLDTFVAALPNGLDTIVGERGVRLSGGQRQRVAIARALYRRPAVLVFDEGTSALDNNTEAELIAALEGLRGERTLITVAHRLTTVMSCDRIIVLEAGRISDSGSYWDLMRRNPAFHELAQRGANGAPQPVVTPDGVR